MLELRAGSQQDAVALARLILLSASELLPFMFGSSQRALAYLSLACEQIEGQYAATRHQLVVHGNQPIACMSLWHYEMPQTFQQGTLQSLIDYLSPNQLKHIVSINRQLAEVFLPPSKAELCIGHLAVSEQWQGKQVASKLMTHALLKAKQQGKSTLVLDVDTKNHSALAFYQKWDFIAGKSQIFRPTEQTFVRMQRDVR